MLLFRTYIAAQSGVDAFIKRALILFPRLEDQLRMVVRTERAAAEAEAERIDVADMPPHAYRIYSDLIRELERLR